ncbi:ATP-binding protein [Desulfatibacillum aliphaticivorans]|nr:ATP-binding protein [Desulfatibacillum aliphaticivorans]
MAAFLVLAAISVGLTVGLSRYFFQKNFRQFLLEQEKTIIERIAGAATEYYEKSGGWETLKRDPINWRDIVRAGRGEEDSGPRIPPGQGTQEAFPGGRAVPPPPPRAMGAPPGTGKGLPPPGAGRRPAGPGGHPQDILRLGERLCLLDANKKLIEGISAPIGELTLVPVSVQQQTVGWIGISNDFEITDPLKKNFMDNQSWALLVIGASTLGLAIILSIFLAKRILAPIRMLAAGTKDIAAQRFQVRLPISRSDELGRLASDFNTMAGRLEKSTQMQKQWVSDVSHELRTPLSVLISAIEALQDGVVKPDDQTLQMLHANAGHIQKLVADLHDLSLAESGALRMNMTAVQPWELVHEIVERFQERCTDRGLTVNLKNQAHGPAAVSGDRRRLIQVFTNLMDNSLRHTEMPGVLSICQNLGPGGVTIIFEDSKPGVPDDALPRLFDRLFKADPSRSDETGGSGLGLSICKGIVSRHGGSIKASGSVLGGLRVEITLPLLDESRQNDGKGHYDD